MIIWPPGPTMTCWPVVAAGQGPAAHLLQLLAGGHLLGEQRGLDAVEQPLEPADELGLRDAQLGLGRHLAAERQRQPLQLLAQFGRQPLLELADRRLVDLAQPRPAGLVERRRADLFEQLLDHRADPHHLGRLLDLIGERAGVVTVVGLGEFGRDRRGVVAPRPIAGGRLAASSLVGVGASLCSVTRPVCSAGAGRPVSGPAAGPCRCARWSRPAGAPRRRRRGSGRGR